MSKFKVVNNKHILPGVAFRFMKNAITKRNAFRYGFIRSLWNLVKTHAAENIETVSVEQLKGIEAISVNVNVLVHDRTVLTAITRLINPQTFFEIGTFLGDTTLAITRNNPQLRMYTLDLASTETRHEAKLELTDEDWLFKRWDRGREFHGAPESARIEQLFGDSATFDFTPYYGKMDMVFIDGSHSYSYVKSDTSAAFKMLSDTGTILWHDYPTFPGVFAYLNELGRNPDRKIQHIAGTALAMYSRRDLVGPPPK
jgi:predicted O-methyltransferase YrrM